jgi:hypothetical protein
VQACAWRATDRQRWFDLDSSTPARSAAAASVALVYFDRSRAVGEQFMATEYEEPEDWQDVASLVNADLWLTVEETRGVTASLAAVLEPYRGRALADRLDGSRRVRVMNMVVPHRKPDRPLGCRSSPGYFRRRPKTASTSTAIAATVIASGHRSGPALFTASVCAKEIEALSV